MPGRGVDREDRLRETALDHDVVGAGPAGIAASLACGYLGLIEGKEPRPQFGGDAYQLEPEIPQHLSDSLELFRDNAAMWRVLDPAFCQTYAAVKDAEYHAFLQVISPWEREHLLLNV